MSMTINDLKNLIAHAASPLVSPDNVSIAFVESGSSILAPDSASKLPNPEESGNPWWVLWLIMFVALAGGLKFITDKVKSEQDKHNNELNELREKAEQQEKQLQDVNSKAQELIQRQAAMAQNLIEQQNLQKIQAQQAAMQAQKPPVENNKDEEIDEAISELAMDYSGVDDIEAIEKLKSWIEAG